MICPNCGDKLIEKKIKDVAVDVCQKGCGGLWLDNFELSKLDEASESAGAELTKSLPAKGKGSHPDAKRPCPRCAGIFMRRHFYSIKRRVEIDECPQCAGLWLDAGELAAIRDEYKTEKGRLQASENFFGKTFEADLAAAAAESEHAVETKEKFARALKYILPSYWIPGKQKGGAF
ncbi:MAG: zf-TFIIB domain-containing protein [Elusimicrobia bacterium]|nr:zf-TFIIB domain-containing protein [Elusimicrobiota bacterium]